MKSFFKALILVPVALAIVLFSVANRAPVRVSFDPISRDAPLFAFDVPLFAVVLAAIAAGVLIGGFASWLAQGKHRKAARRNRREAESLRGETQMLRAAVPDSALPALTSGRA
ncbi:lipopolysaccharide assembly protein LapA domain-containing protein [Bosea sp. PAMC 26642]|uniref:lipopolysaccharide assembly protein LapA domain-containing protein n=1 Tax=Bosea sp. (strain PAMC 26642) TaxID=1792307 RepID=UPI0007703DF0|nr:LapA family protein [Bosea sp. PAMC 26642]AMJ63087.1 GMP synthase [Bosea sp. PAMC 26642]